MKSTASMRPAFWPSTSMSMKTCACMRTIIQMVHGEELDAAMHATASPHQRQLLVLPQGPPPRLLRLGLLLCLVLEGAKLLVCVQGAGRPGDLCRQYKQASMCVSPSAAQTNESRVSGFHIVPDASRGCSCSAVQSITATTLQCVPVLLFGEGH